MHIYVHICKDLTTLYLLRMAPYPFLCIVVAGVPRLKSAMLEQMLFSVGYKLWWSRLNNNAEFTRHPFISRVMGNPAGQQWPKSSSAIQITIFPRKTRCADIYNFVKPRYSGRDHHSNWPIFTHLSSLSSKMNAQGLNYYAKILRTKRVLR